VRHDLGGSYIDGVAFVPGCANPGRTGVVAHYAVE
jgi:hypothetical protein